MFATQYIVHQQNEEQMKHKIPKPMGNKIKTTTPVDQKFAASSSGTKIKNAGKKKK